MGGFRHESREPQVNIIYYIASCITFFFGTLTLKNFSTSLTWFAHTPFTDDGTPSPCYEAYEQAFHTFQRTIFQTSITTGSPSNGDVGECLICLMGQLTMCTDQGVILSTGCFSMVVESSGRTSQGFIGSVTRVVLGICFRPPCSIIPMRLLKIHKL